MPTVLSAFSSSDPPLPSGCQTYTSSLMNFFSYALANNMNFTGNEYPYDPTVDQSVNDYQFVKTIVGNILLLAYILSMNIMMLNMLVALMANSMDKIYSGGRDRYLFGRAKYGVNEPDTVECTCIQTVGGTHCLSVSFFTAMDVCTRSWCDRVIMSTWLSQQRGEVPPPLNLVVFASWLADLGLYLPICQRFRMKNRVAKIAFVVSVGPVLVVFLLLWWAVVGVVKVLALLLQVWRVGARWQRW